MFFELEMSLCDRFKAFTPLSLRRERGCEVLLLIERLGTYKPQKDDNTKKIIRRPAGDDWF